MTHFPFNCLYTKHHEWLCVQHDLIQPKHQFVLVGLTDFAQQHIGAITTVHLPIQGQSFDVNQRFATVESTTEFSILAPAEGNVDEINQALVRHPEMINDSPYGEGWIIRLQLTDPLPDDLMTADQYRVYIESHLGFNFH